MTEIKVTVPAIEKLVDYVASGIGSIAGTMLLPWKARLQAKARVTTARGQAESIEIIADAQNRAKKALLTGATKVKGNITLSESIEQRIGFQEEKRHRNIQSVVRKAADELGNVDVPDQDANHDLVARFFTDVQDVSSDELQSLWAKVLAGEIQKPGTTSMRSLSILRNIDQTTARHFARLCSICVFLQIGKRKNRKTIDAKASYLDNYADGDGLRDFGLSYGTLNLLNEHGLITSNYNSWVDMHMAAGFPDPDNPSQIVYLPFRFQDTHWILKPSKNGEGTRELKFDGVSLTTAGQELSNVVEIEVMENYTKGLIRYFGKRDLDMLEVDWENTVFSPE